MLDIITYFLVFTPSIVREVVLVGVNSIMDSYSGSKTYLLCDLGKLWEETLLFFFNLFNVFIFGCVGSSLLCVSFL